MKFIYNRDRYWWCAKSNNGVFNAYITKVGPVYCTQLWFNDRIVHDKEYTKLSSAKRGLGRALCKLRWIIANWFDEAIRFYAERN